MWLKYIVTSKRWNPEPTPLFLSNAAGSYVIGVLEFNFRFCRQYQ